MSVRLIRGNQVFSDGSTQRSQTLGKIEREIGTKFFDSKDKLFDAGIKRANAEKKWRESAILGIRREKIKKELDGSDITAIDDLLKKQRSDRSLAIFLILDRKLNQLSSSSSDKATNLKQKVEKVKETVEAGLKKIAEDQKFINEDAVFCDVLQLAQDKNRPAMIVYIMDRLHQAEQPCVDEEMENGVEKSTDGVFRSLGKKFGLS